MKQEILDEIEGQKKEVTSPLGLLAKLCQLASQGNFTAIVAPQVKFNREQAQKLRVSLENQKNLENIQKQDSSNIEAARANLKEFYTKK